MKLNKAIKETIVSKIRTLNEQFSSVRQQEILKRQLFYQKFVNKNDLCFDVGANMGNRITPLLKIGAKVVAVEPQEDCYKFLRNKFGNRITLITKGLCEKECTRKFHISNASTISSFSDEWISSVKDDRFKEYSWSETVDVEMTTLDNLVNTYGVPDFIKIDVEGYELEVLKGLSKPVKMISFEYMVPEQTGKLIQCIKTVESKNSTILCNYSIGESMEWALIKWLPINEFIKHVETFAFLETGFGDIYLKQNNN